MLQLEASHHRDTREDLSLKDAMLEDEASQSRSVLGQEPRNFASGSSMDKPKWLRQAEAKAAKIIQEAEENASRPARYTKTPSLKVKVIIRGL